jgi:hypothetical protein
VSRAGRRGQGSAWGARHARRFLPPPSLLAAVAEPALEDLGGAGSAAQGHVAVTSAKIQTQAATCRHLRRGGTHAARLPGRQPLRRSAACSADSAAGCNAGE